MKAAANGLALQGVTAFKTSEGSESKELQIPGSGGAHPAPAVTRALECRPILTGFAEAV